MSEKQEFERRLAADASDQRARVCLMAFAQMSRDFAMQVRLAEWYLDHPVQMPSFAFKRSDNPDAYDQHRKNLLAAIDRAPNESIALVRRMGAAFFVAAEDLPRAIALMEGAYRAARSQRGIVALMAKYYASDVLRGGTTGRAALDSSGAAYLLYDAAEVLELDKAKGFVDYARQLRTRPFGLEPSLRQVAARDSGEAAPNAPATRIRVGGQVQSAKLVRRVEPVYPPRAAEARIQGTVRFEVILGRDGKVANLRLVSGHPLLIEPATDALRQWEYSPTLLNGAPVEVATTVDIVFSLAQ